MGRTIWNLSALFGLFCFLVWTGVLPSLQQAMTMLKGADEMKANLSRIYQSIEQVPNSPYLSNDKGLDRPAPKTPHNRVIPVSQEVPVEDCKAYQTSLAKTARDLGGSLGVGDIPCLE